MTARLDTLANRDTGPLWQECSAHYALRVLTAEQAELLSAALDNPHVAHVEIAEALAAYGVHVSGPSIGRHRNGRCRCERA
jgi:hypothetical protein